MFSSRTTCAWNQWNHRTLSCKAYARPTWKRGRGELKINTRRRERMRNFREYHFASLIDLMLFLLSVFQLIASTQSATINVVCSVVLADDSRLTSLLTKSKWIDIIPVYPACSYPLGLEILKCGDDKINLKLDSVSWILFRIENLLHCDLFYLVAKIGYWGFIKRDQKLKQNILPYSHNHRLGV